MHIRCCPRLECCAKIMELVIYPVFLRIDVDAQRTLDVDEQDTAELEYSRKIGPSEHTVV